MDNFNRIYSKIKNIKKSSGTHSPSIDTLLQEIPELNIQIDACFLSNPYATELFLKYLTVDLLETGMLREVLEYYPPQNQEVAKHISRFTNVNPENIFVGNGAIEVIQAVMHNFVEKKILINLPTFSSYYEFVKPSTEVIYHRNKKELDFQISKSDLLGKIKKERPDTVVIINPNNPDGGYMCKSDLVDLFSEMRDVKTLILDISFIHFAFETSDLALIDYESLINTFPNLIIIKSMSKDFGIAGLRAGYGIMSPDRVKTLLQNGYLWNISGLSNYFFKLFSSVNFQKEYEPLRKIYIANTFNFIEQLRSISGIKVYPSKSNFALIELLNDYDSFEFTIKLLVEKNIYVRDCSDKIGLEGSFIRVASRTFEENNLIYQGIKSLIN